MWAYSLSLLAGIVISSAITFTAVPATDLQPLFNINPPFLGADVGTSFAIGNSPYLWLYGDTLIGNVVNGSRAVKGMPRNSISVLTVSDNGYPQGNNVHYIKFNESEKRHVGFFSPSNVSQWYWPIAGFTLVGGPVFIVAMRVEKSSSYGPLFPFDTVAMDVLRLGNTSGNPSDWSVADVHTIPNTNVNFTIGNAATVGPDGYVYLLGGGGPPQPAQDAFLCRISESDVLSGAWDRLRFYTSSSVWQVYSTNMDLQWLFPSVPPETSLAFHPRLGLWYILILDSMKDKSVLVRTSVNITGPWSDTTPVYDIPKEQWAKAHCYTPKAHPEFTSAGANEIVFSYVCNTPTYEQLLNRTDCYVPQLIRAFATTNT